MIYVKTKHSKLLHNINIRHNKYDGNDFDGETIFFSWKIGIFSCSVWNVLELPVGDRQRVVCYVFAFVSFLCY